MSATGTKMTVEEFLALPDDGVDRWLVDGEVWEFGTRLENEDMTKRNRTQSYLMTRFARFLDEWTDSKPKPRGRVASGEAGIRFGKKDQTSVGVDVAYLSPEVASSQTDKPSIIVGVPTLVVEILSPSDTQKNVADKVRVYLNAGVKHVWVVDPDLASVRIYRPNGEKDLVDASGILTAEPDMPGLRIDLTRVFDF
jgi:Uma2 family endonuclease